MPIYEFYCAGCHTIYNFLSRSVTVAREPSCPRCGRQKLERRPSSFAISKGRKESADLGDDGGIDATRLERAMEQLTHEADAVHENDPRSAARFLRRLYATAGLEPGTGLTEALTRLEAGEDPDSIERDLGDVLDDEPGMGEPGDTKVARLSRRFLPPRVDPELHEL